VPLSVDQVLRKAKQLATKGEANLAALEYKRVLEKYPRNKRAINGLKAIQQSKASPSQEQKDELVALYNQGRTQQTLALGEALAKQFPDEPFIPNTLGAVNFGLGRLEQALVNFATALQLKPDYALAYVNQGKALTALGKPEEAAASYTKALQLIPGNAEVHNSLGNALSVLGKREEAQANYRKVLQLRPDYTEAHRNLSVAKTYQAGDPHIQQMRELLDRTDLSDKDRMLLNFAMGKACDDIGNYDESFAFFWGGNRLRKKELKYDVSTDQTSIERIKSTFRQDIPELVDELKSADSDAPKPIFILGMPRSGTSLVEQILASHSQVYGAGELVLLGQVINSMTWNSTHLTSNKLNSIRESYFSGLKRIGASEPVVTDKMPFNFLWIGFVVSAMPEAKIVHVRRDARATCWSNFANSFSGEGSEFSYDLEDVARYYNMYNDLMTFWHEMFPGQIFDLNYEALTENQEVETRKLLEYVDLDWEERCLDFHKTKRAVRTASAQQVRQKMYQGSSNKWRKYQKHLDPMLKLLDQ
jgi:tetratricopeptide (TPR) repeat protein